eukprot:CAMPEP_0178875218 /NCGR_PEP_ID=MMETSP0747-20121128/9631_1 /TAXON_ID=913974 /ORGANISM="Nitzschia punctata, Strain CCMP561" /LENGTH=295 /DNA_ID=CAMNT_0020542667 /DNA_START=195 /DNA_END=1078 /DNA_ORIENTATION=+
MSEFETDAAKAEVSALDRLPWPPDMKDQVWMERVRLRQFCKKSMKTYKKFWDTHGEDYEVWFYQLSKQQLRRWFQLPRTEIMERLQQQKFHLHASFGTVLCAVTEQVAHFEMTHYPVDGRGEAETGFEEILAFDRRGGFTLKDDSKETRRKWLIRHKALGGPKLLERNEKKTAIDKSSDSDDEDDDGDADDAIERDPSQAENTDCSVPSFRSDRRIVRWLIRHKALGGPKLLERNEKKTAIDKSSDSDDEDDDGDADDAIERDPSQAENTDCSVPSFRSDRRIVRWLIRHKALGG